MSQLAVRASHLAKQYRIVHTHRRYNTLRDTLMSALASPFERVRRALRGDRSPSPTSDDTLWALEDVSFDVKHGELVGIIGRNGAGKSTLLKILARITEPTRGTAEIYGRVGSLLEVGTGFHQELSGRDNIYLSGAILGMRRAEITQNFDEIVAFAEVERFIDTPVKHYSSGMYLRLAFAVAAHLQPEILIVDEVLAVGDARFQKKCLQKMQTVGQEGRTVLFVSHNMQAITRLCERVVLLGDGVVVHDGPAHHVVRAYLDSETGLAASQEWPDERSAPGGRVGRLRGVRVRNHQGCVNEALDIRRHIDLEMEFDVHASGWVLMPFFRLYTSEGMVLCNTLDGDPTWRGRARAPGRYISTARVPGNLLSEGTYFLSVGAMTPDGVVRVFHADQVVAFQIIDSIDGDSARGDYGGKMTGVIRPLLEWRTEFDPAHTATNGRP